MQNSGALCKFLVIAFIPYLAVGAMDGSINLVPNPSFEYTFTTETVGKVPLYWSRFSGAQSTIDLNSDSVQGDFGLTLTDGGTSLSAGILSDIIVVEPDQVYQASCWCKRGSTAARPQMILQFVDAAGNEIKQLSTMVGAVGVWAESDVTFTVPSGVSRLRMLLYSTLASVGTTSFDCVSLVLAEQRVSDGGFDGARIGLLPEHWTSAYKPEGVRQSVERDSGVSNHGLIVMLGGGGSQQEMNKSLCLYDASSSTSCGVWRKVAAAPDVPYQFTAAVRKADGSGSASIYLKFYNSRNEQIATFSSSTSSKKYTALSLARVAPAETAYARVLCYINSTATGTAYFDNISFTENYTLRYAAPLQMGNGSGTNALTAAAYTSSTFWNSVSAAAQTSPVKVVMASGTYASHHVLAGVGHSAHHTLITGEKPFGMNYVETGNLNEFLRIENSRNIVLRHLHFSATEDSADLAARDPEVFDYYYVLRIGSSKLTTENIRCEGLTFTGLLLVRYGITGAHYAGTSNVRWERCAWTRCGYDIYDHCIYNANDSGNLVVNACYFQDCNGAYVRFRNRSSGSVSGCVFLATGTQPTGDRSYRRNHTFIQLAAFNPVGETRDETIGTQFSFKDNSFTYQKTTAAGDRNAFDINASGIMPVNHPGFHMVSKSDGSILANESYTAAVRVALIKQYFGLDLVTGTVFSGNTFSGVWSYRFTLRVAPSDTSSYWSSSSQNCGLDNLVGIN